MPGLECKLTGKICRGKPQQIVGGRRVVHSVCAGGIPGGCQGKNLSQPENLVHQPRPIREVQVEDEFGVARPARFFWQRD